MRTERVSYKQLGDDSRALKSGSLLYREEDLEEVGQLNTD